MTFRSSFPVVALLVMFALAGCGRRDRKPGDTVKRPGQPPITSVDENDQKMNAAIDKARSTADQFIEALAHPTPTQSEFSVKLPVKDGDYLEHMWILPVHYEHGTFTGTINNEPDNVKTVKIGDTVSVAKNEISDWMYIDKGKLVGGATLRVLRDTLSESERKEFVESIGFEID